jgi:exodeoxyribonuclease-5
MLNEEQTAAYLALREYIQQKNHPDAMKLLEGYAGTGKTFVISKLIKEIVLMMHLGVAVTAPTNKAVKVLRTAANYQHQLIVYKTLHSLLGLKEHIDDRTGVQSFIPSRDPEDSPLVDEIRVLIVDESSMMPDDLLEMLLPYVEEHGLKIIFMGDPVQIPPVNKTDSYVFMEHKRKELRIGRHVLSQVVRQKEGNPILELATAIRMNYKSPSLPYEINTRISKNSGTVLLDRMDRDTILKIFNHFFNCDPFKENSDFMKIIAWTNDTVDILNNNVRTILYPEGKTKIMVGEKLIADEPITLETPSGKEILYTTNDEFEVESYTVDQMNLFGKFIVKFYNTRVFSFDERDRKRVKEIRIVHEESDPVFKELKDYMIKDAKNETDKWKRVDKWKVFYATIRKFASVKYNYAITCHKSQGSTYENAMIIDSDISKNRKVEERNRIRYVAATRAKNLLFIVK